jgi:hypothetical protein
MIRRKGESAGRVPAVVLFLLLGAASANAYTLVMRDGRRVEIPDAFTVTNSTLTYEVSSGIQVTVQLSTVNIGATERANGEAPGSFRSKTAMTPAPEPSTLSRPRQARPTANRSITNADLEEYRRMRVASEKAYEKRRQQLGLPSREASQRELAAVTDRTHEQLRNKRDQEDEGEAYWRGRASSLRTEIAANEAQINVVSNRLRELPVSYSLGVYDTSPFGGLGYPPVNGPFPNYPVWNPFPNNRRNRGWNRRYPRYPQTNVLIAPYDNYDYNEERLALRTQLNELQMQRATLGVRWRELEEEARRAGAYPGWLRP